MPARRETFGHDWAVVAVALPGLGVRLIGHAAFRREEKLGAHATAGSPSVPLRPDDLAALDQPPSGFEQLP